MRSLIATIIGVAFVASLWTIHSAPISTDENPVSVTSTTEACVMLAGSVDDDPSGADRVARELGVNHGGVENLDYLPVADGPGEWIDENGDGRILGYSLEEDSPIWSTAACAVAS